MSHVLAVDIALDFKCEHKELTGNFLSGLEVLSKTGKWHHLSGGGVPLCFLNGAEVPHSELTFKPYILNCEVKAKQSDTGCRPFWAGNDIQRDYMTSFGQRLD